MRLIDADYIKNLPFERMIHTDFGDTAIPIEEIDNAPTVRFIDVFNNYTYLNQYNRYSEPELNKYISRIDNECIMLECPECKSRIISTAFSFAVGTKGYSFCPYCGSDMRNE